jgi:hypothetical protein
MVIITFMKSSNTIRSFMEVRGVSSRGAHAPDEILNSTFLPLMEKKRLFGQSGFKVRCRNTFLKMNIY